jgi:hypothetical protein
MKFKTSTELNDFPEMEARLNVIDGKSISVGAKGEHAWLASIHEYGCHIKITPKMRAWLHRNGFHVKDSTSEIVIPERSFLRSGFDACHERAIVIAERALPLVIEGKQRVDEFYDLVGGYLRDNIQRYATDLKDPPKHEFTLKMHPNKENPLVQSGDMIGHIEYEVE